MKYVLDTNVVSEFARKDPHFGLIRWLDTVPHGSLAIPFSAVAEIQRGITELAPREPEKAMKLQQWLEELLQSDIAFLPMDIKAARILGSMSGERSLRGLWVSDGIGTKPKMKQDLSIAATAISYNFPIATRNVGDVLRIDNVFPLPGLFNPFEVSWVVPPRKPVHQVTR